MEEKVTSSTSIIGGADGPASIFLVGKKDKKLTLKQKIHRIKYRIKRKYVEKHLKADAHSMEQVCEYIINVLGYKEIDKTDLRYSEEYKQMRASFILQYRPELLGELASVPKLESHNKEALEEFYEQLDRRQKAAEVVPVEMFDIDLHIYNKSDEQMESSFTVEMKYDYIGGSSSGNKRSMKKYHRDFKNIYRYYGVTQEDIDNHTKRYEDVVKMLVLD